MAENQNIEYKESWRDECIALGAELPRYEILGTGIRVYLPALRSALINQPETSNRQDVGKDVGLEVGLAEKIIDLILEDSEIKMSEMAEKLEVTTRTIEREMKKLRESGHVIRVGGKRYGHWEVR
jgi:ATP-dependent DNA helicase RecG